MFIEDMQPEGSFLDKPMKPITAWQKIYSFSEMEVAVAVGEPALRKRMAESAEAAGFLLATLVHPQVRIRENVVLEAGAILLAPPIVLGRDIVIGKNTIVQSFSSVGHGSRLGQNCNLSPYSIVAGGCSVGDNVFIGIHACIKQGLSIGDNAYIGMGTPVMRNVPPNRTVFHALPKMVAHDERTCVFGSSQHEKTEQTEESNYADNDHC